MPTTRLWFLIAHDNCVSCIFVVQAPKGRSGVIEDILAPRAVVQGPSRVKRGFICQGGVVVNFLTIIPPRSGRPHSYPVMNTFVPCLRSLAPLVPHQHTRDSLIPSLCVMDWFPRVTDHLSIDSVWMWVTNLDPIDAS